MCGRFSLKNKNEFKKKYGVDITPNYNISPTSPVQVFTDKVSLLRWSYSPKWAKKSMNLHNARSETLFEKPSFSDIKRCVFIIDGWYEWKRENIKKIPYYHHLNNNLFNIAGIYNDIGCAIITRSAIGKAKTIHHRQPVLLTDDETQAWLNGGNLFDSKLSERVEIYKVSSYVNSPRNNGSKCIERIN